MPESILPQNLDTFIKQNSDLIIIDVRTSFEFRGAHLDKAISIPLNFLESELDQIPINSKILLYCAHGVRSAHAGALLKEYGYETVYHLEGGLASLKS